MKNSIRSLVCLLLIAAQTFAETMPATSYSGARPHNASATTGASGGYLSETSVTVTIDKVAPTLTNFSASPDPVCSGNSVTFSAIVSDVTGSYSYTLTNGSSTVTGTSSTSAFSQSLVTTDSGIQAFTLTVSNNGLSATDIYELTVSALPDVTLTASSGGTLICGQTSLTLTASGGDDFFFTGPNILSQDPETGIAVVNAAGVYSVTVTNTETGCFSTTVTTVSSTTNGPSVSINPSSTTLTNASPSASLTAVGVGTFLWSTGATTQVISVTSSGTYSVTLTSPGAVRQPPVHQWRGQT
ncbi:hypothetical protein GO730_06685 [Spirosoma sp. HMF3257]|uniref:Uncharacterized protein n=1 Tax=Spirosoma telluris TaxID=2183553 RepID=A0A327NH26_9BACT|nr:hypothetical protein [Spirosoma telluris]RAI74103.1 hypothetical protein HMF3257_06625 [Spirosoma telluris]